MTNASACPNSSRRIDVLGFGEERSEKKRVAVDSLPVGSSSSGRGPKGALASENRQCALASPFVEVPA